MQLPAFFGHRRAINLLPRDDFESSTLGVVLGWALVFGKWCVIITQLIVMGTFLWRFSLDRRLTDLRKEIAKEVAIVKSYDQIERDFTLAQKQVGQIKKSMNDMDKMTAAITEMEKLIPAEVWLDKMTVNTKEVALTAYAANLGGFGTLINRVQISPMISQVRVSSVESGTRGAQLQFEVNLTLKDKP